MKFITVTFLLFFSYHSISQNSKINKIKSKVLKEGFLLYESEKASWHGTDLFFENFTDKSNVGGYVSYTDGDNPKCVFVSKKDKSKVIGTITFNKKFDLQTATVDLTERPINKIEKEYLSLREKAIERINNDTIFKYYKNINFNVVPLISGKEKKVYVLTASTENGKVAIGNDYLIEFNAKKEIVKTERLHKGMLLFEYRNKEREIISSIHSHLPGYCEIITATDICTLMLYHDYTKWETHTVLSKDYVSIWDCKKNQLVVMTREDWDKISKN